MKPSETFYEQYKKLERRKAREKKLFSVLWILFIALLIAGAPLLYRIVLHYLRT